jgi:hypothetical protein
MNSCREIAHHLDLLLNADIERRNESRGVPCEAALTSSIPGCSALNRCTSATSDAISSGVKFHYLRTA